VSRFHRPELAIGALIGDLRVLASAPGGGYRAVDRKGRHAIVDFTTGDGPALRAIESHPGVAAILARGVHDGRSWRATEIPNGMPLYDVIAKRTLEPRELSALVREIATVLDYAHDRGVIHGALALRSITLSTGELPFPVCIADWGAPADTGVYAAPERGRAHDGRVDVYALGVIAFRSLLGRFPAANELPPPSTPRSLARLIARMTTAQAELRPTAGEVVALASELLTDPPGTPRFASPRWTPAPPITSELTSATSGEIDDPSPRQREP